MQVENRPCCWERRGVESRIALSLVGTTLAVSLFIISLLLALMYLGTLFYLLVPLNEAPIPVTQLSADVGSRIASNWAGQQQSALPPPPPMMAQPSNLQGYEAPGPSNSAYATDPSFQPPSQLPEHDGSRPGYMRIRVPPMDMQSGRVSVEQLYEGPLLSSHDGLTPLGDEVFRNRRVSSSGSRSGAAVYHPGSATQGTPIYFPRERNLSVPNDYRIPTPLFGSQLSPPADPLPSVLHSRQTSVSGEPFQWDAEDDRYGSPYRVPSFADVGRIPSNMSNISNERGGYASPYQYRDFSFNSNMRRSVSAANPAPGE